MAAAAAADVRTHWWDFDRTFSMERVYAPALVELVRLFARTTDKHERYQATVEFATRFIRLRDSVHFSVFAHMVVTPLVGVLTRVVQMDGVTGIEEIWNHLETSSAYDRRIVAILQVHCFLLPRLSPADVRRLEQMVREKRERLLRNDALYSSARYSAINTLRELENALAPLFAAARDQHALRATQLLNRLEDGSAAPLLPRLPRELGHHVASFLVPPAFAHDLRARPSPPNAAQVARQLAFVQHAEQAAAAAQAELERRQGVRRRLEQDHKEQEKEKQQKRE